MNLDNLIHDTMSFNREMNDPRQWKKRRMDKLDNYDLPKIAAEGRQNILRQEVANIPELQKLDWEKSGEYLNRQLGLIAEKNVPEIMTARTNAGYKDYLTGPVKHSRDIEDTLAEQVHQIRWQDIQMEAEARRQAAVADANTYLGETSAYGGTPKKVFASGISVPSGSSAANPPKFAKQPDKGFLDYSVQDVFDTWKSQYSPIWDKDSWSLDNRENSVVRARIPSPATATVPPYKAPVAASPRVPAYYEKYFGRNPGVPTTSVPGTYLEELNAKQLNNKFQRRRNRELTED
jgi:hypothetical protein